MKKYVLLVLLAVWSVLILVLSFQNGTETAATSFGFTEFILKMLAADFSQETLILWDGRFRLFAHPGIFFLCGVLAVSFLDTLKKSVGMTIFLSLIFGIILAIVSEVGKLPIEGRHCDFGEMGLNVLGVIVGCILSGLIMIVCRKKSTKDKKRTL